MDDRLLTASEVVEGHPVPTTGARRLTPPGAVLSRTDLAELGWPRRGVDAIFRRLPVVVIEGYSRPFVRAADYEKLLVESTFDGSRVRP